MSWITYKYTMGLRSIENAYRTSRRAFDAELSYVDQRIQTVEHDDDIYSEQDHLIDRYHEATFNLRYLNEAFIVILYHFVEKQFLDILSLKEFKIKEIEILGEVNGFNFEGNELERMRRIVNCIKHGKAINLESEVDLFDEHLMLQGVRGYGALRIRNEDVERAIKAVRASLPRPQSTDHEVSVDRNDLEL